MDTNVNLIPMNLGLGLEEFMISQEEIYFFILLLEMKKVKMLLKMEFGIK